MRPGALVPYNGRMSYLRLLRLSLLALVVARPALAEEPKPAAEPAPAAAEPKLEVKRETLGIPGANKQKPSREKMMTSSRDVTRGYYNALIQGKYEEAASFLHPTAVEPLRARVLEDLEKGPPAKTKNTLAALAVKDLDALRTMSLDDFYVVYAKSPYGQGLQVLAKKDLAVDVVLDPPSCSQVQRVCQVNLKLRSRNEKGEKTEAPNTVWVLEHQGRWLLLHKPPA